jgi:putative ABC transport system permease protein
MTNLPARRSFAWLEDAWRDLLYAVRTLSKAPAFTAVAVLTLALGIGAVTVIYSVVHNVIVDPLPYRDADRLVNVYVKDSQSPRVRGAFTAGELIDFRDQASVFEDVVGTMGQTMNLETGSGVESLRGVWVTPNFFEFMGLAPLLGRTPGPTDAGLDAQPVAVLRHRAWIRFFGADPGVVGTTILVNGERRTVIGVMPPRFTWHAADLWIPAALDRAAGTTPATVRNFQARLAPGVTLQQAEAQIDAVAQTRAQAYPKDYPEKFRMQVVNVIDYTVGPFSGVLYTALGAVGFLLLIACCNVANMLLARATTREREMLIRAALGAGRSRILRQLTVESLLLAAGGAVVGCLLAYAGIGALVARLPQGPLPGEVEIALNGPVLIFSLGAAGLSALLFGLAPSFFTARRDLVDGLKGTGRNIAGAGGRLRNALVAAEIALSLVLVLSAGLLMRSFVAVMAVDPGFNTANLLVVPVNLPARYVTPAEKQRFYDQSLARIASLPGVSAAAATMIIPPFEAGPATPVEVPGEAIAKDASAVVQPVTSGYFAALGLRLAAGTGFGDLAAGELPRLAVVNQAFVEQYLGGRSAVGTSIRLLPGSAPEDPGRHGTFEIAGVVPDVMNRGLRQTVAAHVYLPWSSSGRGSPVMLVRTTANPANSIAAIRHELAAVDRQVAVIQPVTVAEVLDRSYYAQPRFSLLVLGIFGGAGTILVAIGVFSVMAYTVSRQKKEIAVRLALGASRGHVSGLVLRLGARLLAVGGLVGLLASFAAARLLSNQLWNVSPHDPLTIVGAAAVVSLVALTACYLPARRAMRVDPIGALRQD